MFHSIVFAFLFLCAPLACEIPATPEPFALFTIGKSGSHLLMKAIYQMTGFTPKWHTVPISTKVSYYTGKFPWTHFCLSEQMCAFYAKSDVKKIVAIRDLRDVCVSVVHQILKRGWPDEFSEDKEKLQRFKELSFDEQLLYVIHQDYPLTQWKINVQLSLAKAAPQAVQFCADPAVLVCRYEDLVGPEGGGSKEAQLEIMAKIATHINVHFSKEEIEQMADSLYGEKLKYLRGRSTFREGKIGGWRAAFNEEHKQAFKEKLGACLIALGYEKDNDW